MMWNDYKFGLNGWQQLAVLPKVDLHRHLEGSLCLQTLLDIAREHEICLPCDDLDGLRRLVQFTDDQPEFQLFMAKFELLRRFYSTKEAIKRMAREVVLDAAADNVFYLELRFSPFSLAKAQGFSLEEVTEWVMDSVRETELEIGITVRLILTILRECDVGIAQEIVDLAGAYARRGIVAVDLAGDELRYSAEPFAAAFRKARDLGLGTTVHAGEVSRPDSIRTAVYVLGAQRIGHGVSLRNEEGMLDVVRDTGVALEMCLTSNLQTGAVSSLQQHPLPDYHRAGVCVTLNSDDPAVSNTTLSKEYGRVLYEMGMSWGDLRCFILNGVRSAFMAEDEKRELEAWFQRALTGNSLSLLADLEVARPKSR